MRRILFTLCLAGSLGLAARAADDAKPTVAERTKTLQADLNKKSLELSKKFREAKDDEEKSAIRKEMMTAQGDVAEKLLALAKENPKDDAAVDAAVAALRMSAPDKRKDIETFVFDTFSESPKIVPVAAMLAQTPAGKEKVTKLAETAKNRDVKGGISFILAESELEAADYPRSNKPAPVEETKEKVAAAAAKLDAVLKEYADVKVPNPRGGTRTVAEAGKKAKYFAENLTVGKTAPDVESELLDGKKTKLSDYRGKVVVLDIWATWCGPCRAMIPHERELTERLKDKPFEFISVSADDKKTELTEFLEKEKMPWTHWWSGPKAGLVEQYQIRFFPTVYVLDAKGVIRFKHVRGKYMDEAVDALLKEKESTKGSN